MTDHRSYQLELVGFAVIVLVFWAVLLTCAVMVLA